MLEVVDLGFVMKWERERQQGKGGESYTEHTGSIARFKKLKKEGTHT